MEKLEELFDLINSSLIQRELGMSDDDLRKSLTEEGLDEVSVDMVLKTLNIIHEECEKHLEIIATTLTEEDEDKSFAIIEKFLLEHGVNEKLIDSIYAFMIFKLAVANVRIIIRDLTAQAKSQEDIKKEIKEIGMDEDMFDLVYTTAMYKSGETGSTPPLGQGTANPKFLRYVLIGIGIYLVGIGIYMSNEFDSGTLAILFGVIVLIIGIVRVARRRN